MNRKLALTSLFVVGLLVASPYAAAQSQQYGSTAGDSRVQEDGKKCFDAVADKADSTCVVLYGHIFDLLNNVPINIQRPPDGAPDLSRGFTGTPGIESFWDFNDLTLYSSPGFVEYDLSDLSATPRLHPERGLSSNVELDTDVPITGYWYLSADFDELSSGGVDHVPPGSGSDPGVGAMPCLTVRMVLQTGRFFGQGDPIASGSLTKTIISGADADTSAIPELTCPGSTGFVEAGKVTEFEVDLGTAAVDIPKVAGFLVYVEWYQYAPSNPNNQDKVYQHQWNLHTGDEYLSRVLIPVKNPVRIEKVRPQFFDSKLYVHGVFNSPWGSYDVDPGSIGFEVYDESGNQVTVNTLEGPFLRYSIDHDGHFKPVNATFAWDYKADGVEPGSYTVRMVAQNWQHTGDAFREGAIVIADDINKLVATDSEGESQAGDPTAVTNTEDSPGPGALVTIVVLGLVGLLGLRRRQH